MPLIDTGRLVADAVAAGRGVAAFNVITVEHAEAIVAGAESAGLPVIVQISQNAVKFHGGRLAPIAAAAAAVAESSTVDASLHLDHVEDVELLHQAPEHRFGSVMFDASRLDYAANVAATRNAADFCHRHGLWAESELGEVGGKDGAHAPGVRTDPDEAARFAADTGVDALAVAVGSSHAMTERSAALDLDLIASIAARVPVPLVLHGSSGVPDEALTAAVAAGMVKINVGTALNIAGTAAVRRILTDDPGLVDPRKYLAPAREAMATTVRHFLTILAPR